jgi:hypothetical protein
MLGSRWTNWSTFTAVAQAASFNRPSMAGAFVTNTAGMEGWEKQADEISRNNKSKRIEQFIGCKVIFICLNPINYPVSIP